MNGKEPEKEKPYDPKSVEERWYAAWIAAGSFHADPSRPGDPYAIVIPPPNVTGSLHMGHALNITLQDVLLRYARMNGRNALWLPGTDHAGIATQNVVERELAKEGISRQELGRDAFIERVWKWKERSGGTILNQLKRLGAACDWERERFTMDEGLSRAVREAFVRLYRKGLVYRGRYIIHWCPRCRTALSDLEVSYVEKKGALWYIRYPGMSGEEGVVVATTRPETMLGDTAVAVNPKDDRYAGLVGTTLRLPLMNRPIPVVADEMVDREFGTGAVKITPAHDVNEFEVARRHELPSVRVIDESGAMTRDAGAFAGMDRFACRDAVVAKLAEEGLLVREEPYLHNIGHCYRCRTVVEPAESMQWFVRTKPLAAPAIRAVREGETRIVPAQWEKTYYEWMENIHDWCISRQIWWGHRIPAFHCRACGKTMVEIDPPLLCEACGGTDIRQEEDVLDTWFSSGLWPFSTLGWPERTADLERYYPTSVLVTGFDILFFWVARMMMMGIEFTGKAPFRDVVIHALVRDAGGEKMSKTRGNVIDPLDVIDRFGADAFRFTLVALAAQGRDIRMSDDRVEGYRNFMNKLYQAGRFVRMHVDDATLWELPDDLPVTDRWILSRLQRVIDEVRRGIEEYRFNEAGSAFYQFVWHEFCDWYLELIKPVLYQDQDPQRKALTQRNLLHVLSATLRLLHPFMPFITEEVWQNLPQNGKSGSIMVAEYPRPDERFDDDQVADEMGRVIEIITALRNIRGEMNIPPGEHIVALLRTKGKDVEKSLRSNQSFIQNLARVKEVMIGENLERPAYTAFNVIRDVELMVPMDRSRMEEEAKRLQKEILKIEKDITFVGRKLLNEQFLAKAPQEVVEEEREKAGQLQGRREKLEESLRKIKETLSG